MWAAAAAAAGAAPRAEQNRTEHGAVLRFRATVDKLGAAFPGLDTRDFDAALGAGAMAALRRALAAGAACAGACGGMLARSTNRHDCGARTVSRGVLVLW